MAAEFVDLYAVLELPLDAERGVLRKRINELYLDAQRNLDHRHFATRVKYQELFEVTLPQARYILLDDGRRDEYNRMVHAFRGGESGWAPAPAQASEEAAADGIPQTQAPASGGFSLENAPGSAPTIEALPPQPADSERLMREREELLKKWKADLEAAHAAENGDKPKARGATTSAPSAFSLSTPAPTAAAAAPTTPITPTAPLAAQPAAPPTPPPAAKTPAPRPKVEISFDSGGESAPRAGESAPGAEEFEQESLHSAKEIEARRMEHRLQITKEVLVNVSLIWGVVGALLVIVPGAIGLIATVGHYYPRAAKPLLGFPSLYLWLGGFLLIGVAAYFASRELAKAMRQKKAKEVAELSYEEVLRRHGKS